MMKYILSLFLILFCFLVAHSQPIDHWETAVFDDDIWRYQVGDTEPPVDWMQPNFDASQWALGNGGFGYGDDDDGTIISNTISVYLRRQFLLVDTAAINMAVLHADYDDAFVAYLNGVEIARSNIGQPGVSPAHDETASSLHEAQLYLGLQPDAYWFSGQNLKNLIVEGQNTLAVQVHNEAPNSSDLSSNFFFSLGINDNSMNYEEPPSWFNPATLESHLPLILITTEQGSEIPDEPKVNAHMGIIDNGPGQVNTIFDSPNDYDGQIAIEVRGASSQMFPKKNYGFETQLEDGSNNNVSLLGLPTENDWVLHGPYPDKTLLRNVLAYHMGEATGKYTPRTRLCEVFINGDYRGVYILTERIKQDDNRVDIAKLNPEDIADDEITGGYILQIDRDDPDTEQDGWWSNYSPEKFYAFHDPNQNQLVSEQKEYIENYINIFEDKMQSASYESQYLDYVDVDSWVDYFLVTEVGKHIDAYKLSFYLYKRKLSNGGKLHFGPLWDFNLGYGNFDFGCSPNPPGWSYQFINTCGAPQPFWVERLTEIPNVSHQINCRWTELREGAFHTDSLLQFIDAKVAEIGPAQQRNFERWPIIGEYVWPNDFIGGSYEEEIDFFKNWLTNRLNWMDNNMLGDCALYTSAPESNHSNNDVAIFPNPAKNFLFVELSNTSYQDAQLVLFDILGQQVQSFQLSPGLNRIEWNDLKTGVYAYVINNENVLLESGRLILNQ